VEIEFEYFLEVISSVQTGKRFVLAGKEHIIGRKELHFDGSTSREHFLIKIKNDVFFVRDLNAANRTALNGDYIDQNKDVALSLGDIIRAGQTRLKFTSEEVQDSKPKDGVVEMPYENIANTPEGNVSEPDKRGLEINLEKQDTAFENAVDKFRKLTKFESTEIKKSGAREVKRINVDLSKVKPAKKKSKIKTLFLVLCIIGLN